MELVPALAAAVILAALVAAVFDIVTYRIPNWLVLVVAVLAVVKGVAAGLDVLGWSALHAAIALLIGMGLFALGWIGGGDAKLYAALALAVPLEGALAMLGWSSIGGLVLILVMAIARRVAGKPLVAKDGSRWSVPYGVAIFVGGTGALLQTPM